MGASKSAVARSNNVDTTFVKMPLLRSSCSVDVEVELTLDVFEPCESILLTTSDDVLSKSDAVWLMTTGMPEAAAATHCLDRVMRI
mmetsp:Transcript_81206/g.210992  ORF Transcript_81206/g.210992 Transcript_81206/m.210992 type:complete len:86 (-) Transcript_81206:165-422(-)